MAIYVLYILYGRLGAGIDYRVAVSQTTDKQRLPKRSLYSYIRCRRTAPSVFICHPFRDNGFQVFFVALIACTALEYFTGWLMETMFGKQFWDYSMFRITYKNRISLVSSLFWGVMGLFVTYVVSDITLYMLNNLPYRLICIAGTVISLVMAIDFLGTARKQIDVDKLRSTFSISNISTHIMRFDVIASRIPGFKARTGEKKEEDSAEYKGDDENDDR